jgi:hypothetical protein
MPIEAYNIDGYNYFKLRDIGIVLDIGIGWNDSLNTISIHSKKGYVESQTVDSIELSVTEAILSYNKDLYSGDGDFSAQSHITLKTVQDGENATAFVMALYSQFKKSGDSIETGGGSNMPVAITFRKDNSGKYQLVEYWVPDVGNRAASSLKNKFPSDLWDKVDTQFYINALQANAMAQAQAFFK